MKHIPTCLEELNETKKIVHAIQDKIKLKGEQVLKDKVVKHLRPLKIDKADCRARVDKAFLNLNNFGSNRDDNDITREIALAILNENEYDALNLNEHNVHSYDHMLRQYDPRKNGANILKHGLSFQEALQIMGSTKDLQNATWSRRLNKKTGKYEERMVHYAKVKDKDEYIVAIMVYPAKEDMDEDMDKIALIGLQVMKEKGLSQDNGVTLSADLSREVLMEIMKRCKQAETLALDNEPPIYVSAWKFDIHNFDSTVMDRIVDEHEEADQAVINDLRQRSLEILKKSWNIT